MDYVIVFSNGLREHLQNLELVFKTFEKHNFKIQLDKSEFLQKVAFLGHIITPNGIKPNPDKIRAVQKFPIHKITKEIKSFLGLLGYYRKFIENCLNYKTFKELSKKKMKKLNQPENIVTSKFCKPLLTNDPILIYPDFSKPFEVTTDASNYAIGAVLS